MLEWVELGERGQRRQPSSGWRRQWLGLADRVEVWVRVGIGYIGLPAFERLAGSSTCHAMPSQSCDQNCK